MLTREGFPPHQLTTTDLSAFAALKIPRELIELARICRVDSTSARRELGIRYKSDHLEGIVFPYLDPQDEHVVTVRLRRDHPDVDPDGRPIAKYIALPGRHHLYFAPPVGSKIIDTSVPVVIVEAEKSALAITALFGRAGRNGFAVATGGCWGWRGTIGKTLGPDGRRVDEKGPLLDLDRVIWERRDSFIAFDANAATNPSVRAARAALAQNLSARGATVRLVILPVEANVNGPDDFIAKHGDDPTLALLDTAEEWYQRHGAKAAPVVSRRSAGRMERPESQATLVVQLALRTRAEGFHDGDEGYVRVPVGSRFETYALRSNAGRAWLRRLFIEATDMAPSAQAIGDAISALEARALVGPQHKVHVRIARTDNAVYLDLATPDCQALEITPSGWAMTRGADVRFRRPAGLLPIFPPATGGTLDDLRRFVNVRENDFILLVAWLVGALRGRGPYPILIVNGEQGSAKSTLCRVVKRLLDPNQADLRSEPRDERDLMIAASNNHVLAFDNLSHISPRMSDALCRLATGGGFATRRLYEGREEEIFDAVRPILINGIPELTDREDLSSRAITLHLPRISARCRSDEERLWRDFEEARPRLLGALASTIALALGTESSVSLVSKPRMADFARWVSAAEPACPWSAGAFLKAYDQNRDDATLSLLEANPLAEITRAIQPWEGTASELFTMVVERASEAQRRSAQWLRSPRQLADALRRLAPVLQQVGLEVSWERSAVRRTIRICRPASMDVRPSDASPASFPQECARSRCDATSDAPHPPETDGSRISSQTGVSNLVRTASGSPHRDVEGGDDVWIVE